MLRCWIDLIQNRVSISSVAGMRVYEFLAKDYPLLNSRPEPLTRIYSESVRDKFSDDRL